MELKDIKSFVIVILNGKTLIFNNIYEALYIKKVNKDYRVFIESYYIYQDNTMKYYLNELKKEPA